MMAGLLHLSFASSEELEPPAGADHPDRRSAKDLVVVLPTSRLRGHVREIPDVAAAGKAPTMGTMWLNLEAGTARALSRRSGVTFDVPPSPHPNGMGWRPLVIVAAHTYFPEASIEDLPMWAAAEVARGFHGPLRNRIATTRPDDRELPTLRDNLMVAIGATPDARGAVSVVDRVYADRLLRHQVPPVITARCLAWYGYWRDTSSTTGSEITSAAIRYADNWVAHPGRRPTIDAQIVELARTIAGHPHPVPLEEQPV